MSVKSKEDRSRFLFYSPSIVAGRILLFTFIFLITYSTTSLARQAGSIDEKLPETTGVNSSFSAPDTANFGLTRTGRRDTIRLPLRNNGIDTIIIDSIRFQTTSSSFLLIDSAEGIAVLPGTGIEIRLGFHPEDTNCVNAPLFLYGHSTATGEPATFHRIGVGGCGGASFIEVVLERIDFHSVLISKCGREKFTVANAGNYPLRIAGMTTSGTTFKIIDPDRFPIVIAPYSSRSIEVEFCPPDANEFFDSIVIDADSENEEPLVHLSGWGYLRLLEVPTKFDVGSVLLGTCIDTFLVVRNSGTVPITVTSVSLADLPLPSGFSFATSYPAGWERTLLPGDTLHIDVGFCPAAEGEKRDYISIVDESGETYSLLVIGRGTTPVIRLDTADVEAGEIATLTLRIGPGDPVGSGPYRVRLSFDHYALSPTDVEAMTEGGIVDMTRQGKGIVVIEGEHSGALPPDGSVFKISFRGLSSGRPTNMVEIDSFEFPAPLIEWDTLHGMVRLSGCEVGRTPVGGKRAHISALGPNPAGESVLLIYQAPSGRHALLTIFDSRGSRISTIDLPEGTDSPQEFRLELGDLPKGLYTIELRERNERSWRILLIDR